MLDVRTRSLIAVVLILVGFFGAILGRKLLPVGEGAWDAQIAADFEAPWRDVLRPQLHPEAVVEMPEFQEKWEARRKLYDQGHMARLREVLHAYLDCLEAEYADAADIYQSGDSELMSDSARRARERFAELLGPAAEPVFADFKENLREQAFRDSPVTAGRDPDLPDWREWSTQLQDWLPEARRAVDRCTTVAADDR